MNAMHFWAIWSISDVINGNKADIFKTWMDIWRGEFNTNESFDLRLDYVITIWYTKNEGSFVSSGNKGGDVNPVVLIRQFFIKEGIEFTL